MNIYKCSGCDFKSKYRSNVVKHTNNLKKCSSSNLSIIKTLNIENIKCEYCNKIYSDKYTKNRHLDICKVKKIHINKIKELENKIEELTTEINIKNQKLIKPEIKINHILNSYTKPYIKGMDSLFDIAIKKIFLSVPTLIEFIHFNDRYPQNKNICITNKRTNDAIVYDGKKWKTVNKNQLIDELIDTYERELYNYAELHSNTYYIKEYELAKKRGDSEKDLKDEVHNIIYDNRKKINTKRSEIEKKKVLK